MGISSNISFKSWPSPSLLWLLSRFRSFVREIRSDGSKFVIKRDNFNRTPTFFSCSNLFLRCCYRENGKKVSFTRHFNTNLYVAAILVFTINLYTQMHAILLRVLPLVPIKTHLMTIINRPGQQIDAEEDIQLIFIEISRKSLSKDSNLVKFLHINVCKW